MAGMNVIDRAQFGTDVWLRPTEIESVEAHLVWREWPEAVGKTDERMLDRFLALAAASDEEIHAYATTYGVLASGPTRTGPMIDVTRIRGRSGSGTYREPVAAWRDIAAHFAALLDVSAALHRTGQAADADAWKRVGAFSRTQMKAGLSADDEAWLHRISPTAKAAAAPRLWLENILNTWLEFCGVTPVLIWHGSPRPRIEMNPRSLLGALVVEVAFTVGTSAGVATCSHCGRTYLPKRKPKAGQQAFCPDCRERGRRAAYQRRRRAAERGE